MGFRKINVPALRFEEFSNEWDKKRLKEVFSIFNGYAFSSSDAKENGCRWVKIADVGINEINHDATSYLPVEFKTIYSKFILRQGDYVVALTRPILGGRLKIARIDTVLDGSLLNQRVGKLESKNDLTFIYSLLQKKSLISRIENRIAGTDPPNLSPNEIDSLNQYIPSLPEQQKIASFLSAIDDRIWQLTRKKELLEQYKKGVIQQFFSGELRFKDAIGKSYPKWEKKKLGDIFEFFRGSLLSKPDLIESGKYLCIHYGELFTSYAEVITSINFKTDLENGFLSKKGDILMPSSDVTPKGLAKASSIQLDNVILGGDMNILRPNSDINSIFFSYLLNFNQQKIIQKVTGTTVKHIYNKDVKMLEFKVPSAFDEQKKIADFLQSIDSKIEIVKVQILQTQVFKKGLLQQMFV